MLRTLLQQIPCLTPEDIAAFVPLWKKRVQLSRYDFLIQQGQVEQGLYFVTRGALRIYFPLPDEEICVGPNNLLVSIPSFVDAKPSSCYIKALRAKEQLLKQAVTYAFVISHLSLNRREQLRGRRVLPAATKVLCFFGSEASAAVHLFPYKIAFLRRF